MLRVRLARSWYSTRAPSFSGAIQLKERSFLRLDSKDAGKFLQGLTTNDVMKLEANSAAPNSAQFTALLTPQGRIMFDAFLYRIETGHGACSSADPFYLIECESQARERLLFHLQTYNLRSRTRISETDEAELVVVVAAGDEAVGANWSETFGALVEWKDSRADWKLKRVLFERTVWEKSRDRIIKRFSELPDGRYHRERWIKGVPEGVYEVPARQAIPLEYNLDLMNGVDFGKGCYLGQELVMRTHSRGVVRKRVMPVEFRSFDAKSWPAFEDSEALVTSHLREQVTEFWPAEVEEGKARILSMNGRDALGRVVVSERNLGLGLVRLEGLKREEQSGLLGHHCMAALDWQKCEYLLARALVPSWWPKEAIQLE